ncbi:MAG TPA: orotidine 5'-phosphate decarboxylase / HUMPS family protein [Candidatus Nanoarchaeia archaeon]|nr:orotidine 5'-phosphate decarboxylase / HUMPS family protein [Candidatus Nanoarchaeia archaeon]
MSLIKLKRSIIPALDVDTMERAKQIVKQTTGLEGIGAYKVGFELVIRYGLTNVVSELKKLTKLPIIYDHQKAGTDIPDTGDKFMKACKEADVDAVIIFPQAGPITEEAWIGAAKKYKIHLIVGGEMTHKGYLESDNGFLKSNTPKRIYQIAASQGVTDYVVPGNKPDKIKEYREFFENKGIKPIFYSPGLISQGGSVKESAEAAGDHWHAIVGRAIYDASDIRKKAEELIGLIKPEG